MTGHSRRTGKTKLVAKLSALAQIDPPNTEGGTIPKSWLVELGSVLFDGQSFASSTKREVLQYLISSCGGDWDPNFVSDPGSTITGEGLAELERVVALLLAAGTPKKASVTETNGNEEEAAMEDEDLQASLLGIAASLASLSDSEVFPNGVKIRTAPFQAAEVGFTSSEWLLRVLEVQGWLMLDREIRLDGRPPESAMALFQALGLDDPDAGFLVGPDGTVALTPVGADHLLTRIETAERLREDFLAATEELGPSAATHEWRQAWEEGSLEISFSDPIHAEADTWPVSEFAGRADENELDLSPTYQRGDVWQLKDSQQLILSIIRGIPIPSVILLDREGNNKFEVVDGKQRLTSILRFMGRHPLAIERVAEANKKFPEADLRNLFETDYRKFRRQWQAHVGEKLTTTVEAGYYFPFKLPKQHKGFPSTALADKYFYEIREVPLTIGAQTTKVRSLFEATTKYKVPVILYSRATPRQIHEVFSLYNKQGKHLNAEEIRNALFHHLAVVRLLLAASGDNTDYEALAPFIPRQQQWQMKEVAEFLDDYGFGAARYKRTKLLSWLVSLVFMPSVNANGTLSARSTAKHITDLFHEIGEGDSATHFLKAEANLVFLMGAIHKAMECHSAFSGWARTFRDEGEGKKWQELQLVATLLGVFLASHVVEDLDQALDDKHEELHAFTALHRRPESAQGRTQWGFIGKVALGVVETLGVSRTHVASKLEQVYGTNCIPTLEAALVHYEPRNS